MNQCRARESVERTAESTLIKKFDSYVVPLPYCCQTSLFLFSLARQQHDVWICPIHTLCCSRAEPIIIRCSNSTSFSMFDSYFELNLQNWITNQVKILYISGKMTVILKSFEDKIQFCMIFRLKTTVCETLLSQLQHKSIHYMLVHIILV